MDALQPRPAGLCVAALIGLVCLALTRSASGQPVYGDPIPPAASDSREGTVPFGLSVVWYRGRAEAYRSTPERITAAFALDGQRLALRGPIGIRVLDARDGIARQGLPADRFGDAYSFAIASSGAVAIGRVGGIEIRGPSAGPRGTRISCTDACGPVLSVSFSPDGTLLAYQGTRGLKERQAGFGQAIVLDARTGQVVTRLDAIAARALVEFSPDGRQLIASNVTHIDGSERYGLRAWRTSDWGLTHNLVGSARRWHAVGRLAGAVFAAAYADEGNLTIRDLAADRLAWSVPLVGPALDVADPAAGNAARLDRVAFAPNGEFVLSYESGGTLVIRRASDGLVEAMYDVAGVSDIAIAPDSRTFAYVTRSDDGHTVMARVPL